MKTIKDIAKAAGVSPASVSRVINNGPKVGQKTREKIKRIIDELGYYPNTNAQAISTKKNISIGVVLADLVSPLSAEMAQGIEKVATEKDIQIFFNSGSFDKASELKAIGTLLEHRYQAMVIHSKALDEQTLINFANKHPGLVLINRYIKEIADRCVWLDDKLGGKLMADYIMNEGHKNIAFINAEGVVNNTAQRSKGIKNAIAKRNTDQTISLIEFFAKSSYQGGEIAVQNLLAMGQKFTAILTYNDDMAIGVISMLKAHGYRVPEDISVIGFGNFILAKCITPKLTTVNNPIEEMAIQATELALALSQSSKFKTLPTYRYVPELIVRKSVKKLTN